MISRRSLLLAAILMASGSALSAQSGNSMLGYVGSASFWLDVPAGWAADQQAAKQFGAVFVLTPPGATFNTAGVVIIGSSFKSKTVEAAIAQIKSKTLSQDAGAQIAELPAIDARGTKMSLIEVRTKALRSQPFETIACVALGQDVVVITLSALAEEPYSRARSIFADLLKSYKEAGIQVQTSP
jgi:hypothetical protein